MAVSRNKRQGAKPRRVEDNRGPVPKDVRQRIAEKAYALYEQRGHRDGYAIEDWLEAEHIVHQEVDEAH